LHTLKQEIARQGVQPLVEIDGGVNTENAPRLYAEGANVLVAGSSVFKVPNPEEAITTLKGIM